MGAPKKKGKLSPSKRQHLRDKALKQASELFSKDSGKARPVHLSDIAAELIRAFKGPRGYALRVYLQFLKAADGSATRTKILDMVGKFVVSESNHSNASGTDVDDLDDDELRDELEEVLTEGVEPDAGDPFTEEDKEALEEAAKAQEMTDPDIAAMEEEIAQMEAVGEDTPGDHFNRLIESLDGANPKIFDPKMNELSKELDEDGDDEAF